MEFTLHRQLKELYGASGATEVRWRNFRIDAVRDSTMIEIQMGSLAAIRNKVQRIAECHPVLVVHPLIANRRLVKLKRRQGHVVETRQSPKHQTPVDLVNQLVFLTKLFPHPNLTIETPLITVEETRFPGRSPRRRRRQAREFRTQDVVLLEVIACYRYREPHDLLSLIPDDIAWPWDTSQLARALQRPRWLAQRLAYCLRQTGVITEVNRNRNGRIYALAPASSVNRDAKQEWARIHAA